MQYLVGIQVIKVYNLTIEADSPEDAEAKAYDMQTHDIYEAGSLESTETDHAAVICCAV
jgi:hypothetical protein